MPTRKIHLGNAGIAGLDCHAPAIGKTPSSADANWTWKPESVTCKRCISIYIARVKRDTGRTPKLKVK